MVIRQETYSPGLEHDIRHPRWGWLALAACAGSILILLLAGEFLRRGHIVWWDDAILRALRTPGDANRPIGPHWLAVAMPNITALGSGAILVMLVTLATGALMIERLWITATSLAMGTLSDSLVISAAKSWFARPRPAIVPHLADVSSQSFPSAHSANSAMVYLMLAALLVQIVQRRMLRHYIMVAAAIVIVLIGTSRAYLGVHYPSDIIIGWCFGILWAAFWWFLAGWARIALSPNGWTSLDGRTRQRR